MWYNGIMLALLRSPLHGAISRDVLALTYVGSKSGQKFTLPVNYVRDLDNDNRLLVTSTPARTWWRNLRDGRPVTLRLRGETVEATAEVMEGVAGSEWLTLYFRGTPQMARYFDVKMLDGEPDAIDIARVAPGRVMIAFTLPAAG